MQNINEEKKRKVIFDPTNSSEFLAARFQKPLKSKSQNSVSLDVDASLKLQRLPHNMDSKKDPKIQEIRFVDVESEHTNPSNFKSVMGTKIVDSKVSKSQLADEFSFENNLLDYKSLEHLRGAYRAALQSQSYTKDSFSRIANGDLSKSLDKDTNPEMLENELKNVYSNLIPNEL